MNARGTRVDGHVRTGSFSQSLVFISPFRNVFSLLLRLVQSVPVFFRREIKIRRLRAQRVRDPVSLTWSKSTQVGRAARARNGRAPRCARTQKDVRKSSAGTWEVSARSPGVETEGIGAAMVKSETPAGGESRRTRRRESRRIRWSEGPWPREIGGIQGAGGTRSRGNRETRVGCGYGTELSSYTRGRNRAPYRALADLRDGVGQKEFSMTKTLFIK